MNKILNKNNTSNIDEVIDYINTSIIKKPIIIVGIKFWGWLYISFELSWDDAAVIKTKLIIKELINIFL